jgi:hypothetical protein
VFGIAFASPYPARWLVDLQVLESMHIYFAWPKTPRIQIDNPFVISFRV